MEMKTLHVLGVSLFVGNIIVSALWKVMADRSRNLHVMRFGVRLVNLTDMLFTGGGITLLLVSGHLMAGAHGGILASPWILNSYLLLGASGLIWLAVLLPIQFRQALLLKQDSVPESYWPLARVWSVAGVVATLLPLPAITLMIAR